MEKDVYYREIYRWCSERLSLYSGPLLIAINGPQGCGKTTLFSHVRDLFENSGVSSIAISVDDFYLTYPEQKALAGENPDNPYLQYRGYPVFMLRSFFLVNS